MGIVHEAIENSVGDRWIAPSSIISAGRVAAQPSSGKSPIVEDQELNARQGLEEEASVAAVARARASASDNRGSR